MDVVTENVVASDGTIKETSIVQRTGPISAWNERPYATVISKSKFTWTGTARNLTKLETTNEVSLTKATTFTYDSYNNQTAVNEYGYAAPGSLGTLLRKTETTYETGSGWIDNNLLGLPTSVKVIAGGVTVSMAVFEYDHNGSDAQLVKYSDIIGYNPEYNPLFPRS